MEVRGVVGGFCWLLGGLCLMLVLGGGFMDLVRFGFSTFVFPPSFSSH